MLTLKKKAHRLQVPVRMYYSGNFEIRFAIIRGLQENVFQGMLSFSLTTDMVIFC